MRNPNAPLTKLEKVVIACIPISGVSILTVVLFDLTGWPQIIIGTIGIAACFIGLWGGVFALMEQG